MAILKYADQWHYKNTFDIITSITDMDDLFHSQHILKRNAENTFVATIRPKEQTRVLS